MSTVSASPFTLSRLRDRPVLPHRFDLLVSEAAPHTVAAVTVAEGSPLDDDPARRYLLEIRRFAARLTRHHSHPRTYADPRYVGQYLTWEAAAYDFDAALFRTLLDTDGALRPHPPLRFFVGSDAWFRVRLVRLIAVRPRHAVRVLEGATSRQWAMLYANDLLPLASADDPAARALALHGLTRIPPQQSGDGWSVLLACPPAPAGARSDDTPFPHAATTR